MSTPGTPLQLCRGRRNGAGPLLGLCITCARQSDKPGRGLEPAAQRNERRVWDCPNRVALVARMRDRA